MALRVTRATGGQAQGCWVDMNFKPRSKLPLQIQETSDQHAKNEAKRHYGIKGFSSQGRCNCQGPDKKQ